MRKVLLILLALAGCLLFSEGRSTAHAARTLPTAVFSVGDASADEWQCERVCNSDLNRPRVLREASSSPAAPVFQRGGLQTAARPLWRGAASSGGTGIAKLFATYRSCDLSVGPHAVDYYVYRLRRLII